MNIGDRLIADITRAIGMHKKEDTSLHGGSYYFSEEASDVFSSLAAEATKHVETFGESAHALVVRFDAAMKGCTIKSSVDYPAAFAQIFATVLYPTAPK